MALIGEEGPINEHTYLIDAVHRGVRRGHMEVLDQNSGRLEDISFLVDLLWEKVYYYIPTEFRALIQPGLADAVDLAARTYAKQH